MIYKTTFIIHEWIFTYFYFRCSRLALVSLSYLWRRNQAEVFDEMIDDGKLNSIIVKVPFS